MSWCAQCRACVKPADLKNHLEEHHVGYSPEEEVQLFCGGCPFRASKGKTDLMVRHCQSSRHASDKVRIEWRDYQRMESERVLELLRIGVEIMDGNSSHSTTRFSAGHQFESRALSPVPVVKSELEYNHLDSQHPFPVRTPIRAKTQATKSIARNYGAENTRTRIKGTSKRKLRSEMDEESGSELGYGKRERILEQPRSRTIRTSRHPDRAPLAESRYDNAVRQTIPSSIDFFDQEEREEFLKVPPMIRPEENREKAALLDSHSALENISVISNGSSTRLDPCENPSEILKSEAEFRDDTPKKKQPEILKPNYVKEFEESQGELKGSRDITAIKETIETILQVQGDWTPNGRCWVWAYFEKIESSTDSNGATKLEKKSRCLLCQSIGLDRFMAGSNAAHLRRHLDRHHKNYGKAMLKEAAERDMAMKKNALSPQASGWHEHPGVNVPQKKLILALTKFAAQFKNMSSKAILWKFLSTLTDEGRMNMPGEKTAIRIISESKYESSYDSKKIPYDPKEDCHNSFLTYPE